ESRAAVQKTEENGMGGGSKQRLRGRASR
ncbi:hypothetical protein Csa_009900, partial [Cucumis sativus]